MSLLIASSFCSLSPAPKDEKFLERKNRFYNYQHEHNVKDNFIKSSAHNPLYSESIHFMTILARLPEIRVAIFIRIRGSAKPPG